MELNEIRKKKKELEDKIVNLINEFMDETDVEISYMGFDVAEDDIHIAELNLTFVLDKTEGDN